MVITPETDGLPPKHFFNGFLRAWLGNHVETVTNLHFSMVSFHLMVLLQLLDGLLLMGKLSRSKMDVRGWPSRRGFLT